MLYFSIFYSFIDNIPMNMEYSFSSKLWVWNDGKHTWSRHFVDVEKEVSEKIKKIADWLPRKWFWSVKVEAMIWFIKRKTSIFPSKKSWWYIMPIKSEIRDELKLEDWTEMMISLKLIET